MKRNNTESRKNVILKRLFLLITVAIFLWGIVTVLGRRSNSDDYIGKITVNVGTDEYVLDGHITSKLYVDKETKYSEQNLSEIADSLVVVKSNPEKRNLISSMNISYVKDYVGDATYTVYDKNFAVAVTPKTKLEIPGDKDDLYYVKINVKWGKTKNYVAMEYYFAMQLDKSTGS